jgi:hypothetical protein
MELRSVEGETKCEIRSGSCLCGDERAAYSPFRRRSRFQSGVSLLELLSVSAVIVLMAGLLYSAVSSVSSSAGRRGGANVLMNTLEHARIAALESGQIAYVGFADEDFPVQEMRYKAFLVFRETSDEERASGAPNYILLKKWTKLPGNLAFKRVEGSLVPGSGGQTFPGLNDTLPTGQRDEEFPSVAFNGSGGVDGGSSRLELFLYEGYSAGSQDVQTRRGSDLFEKISLSRYTGRAQFNVTTTNAQ